MINYNIPEKKNKIAIALLTRVPNKIWINFLKDFKNYDIFFIVDDNSTKYDTFCDSTINFIQIENETCEKSGYKHSSTLLMKSKNVIAWDKAFYYFAIINKNYEDVWLIEDDVFFKSENDLLNIDNRYNSNQVLTKPHMSTENGQYRKWFWPKLTINMDPPYFKCMVCACRMSKSLFESINDYISKNGSMFFIEALIPTLTIKNNLSHAFVKELETILYDKKWSNSNFMTSDNLYHPAKNIEMHKVLRERYEETSI